jgi:proteic killer suppression protein
LKMVYQSRKLYFHDGRKAHWLLWGGVMEVSFATKKLQKQCNSAKTMKAEWGTDTARRLQRRLTEMEGAASLADLRHLPQADCHKLTGDRKGQLAVSLAHPHRLLFVPNHDPVPRKADGGLDWQSVTRVEILGVCDYH